MFLDRFILFFFSSVEVISRHIVPLALSWHHVEHLDPSHLTDAIYRHGDYHRSR